MLNANVPAWFEIPVADLDRAQAFYEAALGVALRRERIGDNAMAVFPYPGKPNASGALLREPNLRPSAEGSLVYLSVTDTAEVLARVVAQGGQVVVPRTALPEGMGVFARFGDSEGNHVGLWSQA